MSTSQQLQQAYQLIKEGRKAEAVQLLTPLVRADNTNADAWWLLANSVNNEDHQRRALEAVLRLRPNDDRAQRMLSRISGFPPAPSYEDMPTTVMNTAPPPVIPAPSEPEPATVLSPSLRSQGYDPNMFGSDDPFSDTPPSTVNDPYVDDPFAAPIPDPYVDDPFANLPPASSPPPVQRPAARQAPPPTQIGTPVAIPVNPSRQRPSAAAPRPVAPRTGTPVTPVRVERRGPSCLVTCLAVVGALSIIACVATAVLAVAAGATLGTFFNQAAGVISGSATFNPNSLFGQVAGTLVNDATFQVGVSTFQNDPTVQAGLATLNAGGIPLAGTLENNPTYQAGLATAQAVQTQVASGLNSTGGGDLPDNLNDRGPIADNQAENATLDDDIDDGWTFTGAAGDVVTIDLEAANSDELDPQLFLYGPNNQLLTSNDDIDLSESNYNSRIEDFELPSGGTYTIVVAAFSGGGDYELTLRR